MGESRSHFLLEGEISIEDAHLKLPWGLIRARSGNSLQRILRRMGALPQDLRQGFSLDQIAQIAESDVEGIKGIGPGTLTGLRDDLRQFCNTQGSLSRLLQTFESATASMQYPLLDLLRVLQDDSAQLLSLISPPLDINDHRANIRDLSQRGKHDRLNLVKTYIDLRRKSEVWPGKSFLERSAEFSAIEMKVVAVELERCLALAKEWSHPNAPTRDEVFAANLGLVAILRGAGSQRISTLESVIDKGIKSALSDASMIQGFPGKYLKQEWEDRITGEFQNRLVLQAAEATTAAEMQSAMHRILKSHFESDDRSLHIYETRSTLFDMPYLTLEELGDVWGVTRERVRQLELKANKFEFHIEVDIWLLKQVAHIFRAAKSEDSFGEKLDRSGIADSSDVTADWFFLVADFFGKYDLRDEFMGFIETWNEIESKDEKAQRLSDYRSKMGLINMYKTSEALDARLDELESLILRKYPRSIFSGGVALARTEKKVTMFDATIIKQLIVASVLSTQELVIGISRQSAYRGESVELAEEDLVGLIKKIAGDSPNLLAIPPEIRGLVNLSNHDLWLVEQFRKSEDGLLHRGELTLAAMTSGPALGSIPIYLASNPILRPCGDGIFTLVGLTPTMARVIEHRSDYLESNGKLEVELKDWRSHRVIRVRSNLTFISSGVLPCNSDVYDVVANREFQQFCTCKDLHSEQMIKFTKDKFWTGFSASVQHAVSKHNHQVGQILVIEFNLPGKFTVLHST